MIRPMKYHGPGFTTEVDGVLYQLWCPREGRDHFAAAWTSEDGEDGDMLTGPTLESVIEMLGPVAAKFQSKVAGL